MTTLTNGLSFHAEPPPLQVDEGGAVRVGKSRVSLDLVVEQYENGMTPEDMVRAYDTLVLADVHAVIAYYLRHRDEVRAYLKQREEEAEALRAKIEAERPRISREELLARRSAREKETRMVITLSPDLEAALKEAASQRGVVPEVLALDVLRERFLGSASALQPRDEWERRLLGLAMDCGVSLPDSALSSEELYD
jgi:uncharacterized protein (DUF433 family)